MASYQFDVLVIGSGIAGLSTAAKLADAGKKVAIVSRDADPNETNTNYAQGGIIYIAKDDDSIEHDIQSASSGTSSVEAIDVLLKRSGDILEDVLLKKAKTSFAKDDSGNLVYTKEAAHSKKRILYHGDYTGKEIQTSLCKYLLEKKDNVKFLTSHTVIDLLTPSHSGVNLKQRYEPNKVVGAYVFNRLTSEVIKIHAAVTVIATGGISSLYLHHSNSEGSRGDGHAMAFRAGAQIINMEFIQFHPTTFFDRSTHRRFLVSETVRGEGGRLMNSDGEYFMQNYHHDAELAPRDVVSRAILDEMIKTKHECVYLDISYKDFKWIKERFPTIYSHCKDKGIDITTVPIPVVPAAHYSCGGIKTDMKGQTSIPHLYAVGEAACTGLHGANRLASTSLLEGLTFGYLAAEDIIEKIDNIEIYPDNKIREWENGTIEPDLALVQQDWLTLKQTMWNYLGIARSSNRILRANAMFKELRDEIQRFYRNSMLKDELIGLRNAVDVAMMVLNASNQNRESVGCFYRKN